MSKDSTAWACCKFLPFGKDVGAKDDIDLTPLWNEALLAGHRLRTEPFEFLGAGVGAGPRSQWPRSHSRPRSRSD